MTAVTTRTLTEGHASISAFASLLSIYCRRLFNLNLSFHVDHRTTQCYSLVCVNASGSSDINDVNNASGDNNDTNDNDTNNSSGINDANVSNDTDDRSDTNESDDASGPSGSSGTGHNNDTSGVSDTSGTDVISDNNDINVGDRSVSHDTNVNSGIDDANDIGDSSDNSDINNNNCTNDANDSSATNDSRDINSTKVLTAVTRMENLDRSIPDAQLRLWKAHAYAEATKTTLITRATDADTSKSTRPTPSQQTSGMRGGGDEPPPRTNLYSY